MGLTLTLSSLASRVTRTAITGAGGIRRFAASALSSSPSTTGNFLEKLWDGFTRFGGFLINNVASMLGAGLKFSWSLIWGLSTSTFQFLWNFNWNASDEQIDESIKASYEALGSVFGGTLGNAMGWLACGALPGAVIFAFNEPLGLYALKNVGEEALEEIAANVANLIRQTGMTLIRTGISFLYKNIRRIWREPDSAVRKKMIEAGIVDKTKIDKAIAERNKPWSFAQQMENFVEGIPNKFIRNFTEEFFEEFSDSCIEAGYVIANSVDSYMAMQRMATDNALGEETTVEIVLNRDTDRSTSAM